MKNIDDLIFPLDYRTGKMLTERQKWAAVQRIGGAALENEPELRRDTGLLAQRIHEQVGSGVGFSRAAIFAMNVANQELESRPSLV